MEKRLVAEPRIADETSVPEVCVASLDRFLSDSAERVCPGNRRANHGNLRLAAQLEMSLVTHAFELEELAKRITNYARSLDQLANLVARQARGTTPQPRAARRG